MSHAVSGSDCLSHFFLVSQGGVLLVSRFPRSRRSEFLLVESRDSESASLGVGVAASAADSARSLAESGPATLNRRPAQNSRPRPGISTLTCLTGTGTRRQPRDTPPVPRAPSSDTGRGSAASSPARPPLLFSSVFLCLCCLLQPLSCVCTVSVTNFPRLPGLSVG